MTPRVANVTFDALSAYRHDVRAGRQIKGGVRTAPGS